MPGHAGSATSVEDPISQFLGDLAGPGHLATFEGDSATVRFDVLDGKSVESWHVSMAGGDVAVTHGSRPADAVVRIERRYLEAIVTGRLNAQAALLRGLFTCEGSMVALITFQRCLPGPPGSAGRVAPITSEAVMAQRGRHE
jgi:hypothetical protein